MLKSEPYFAAWILSEHEGSPSRYHRERCYGSTGEVGGNIYSEVILLTYSFNGCATCVKLTQHLISIVPFI